MNSEREDREKRKTAYDEVQAMKLAAESACCEHGRGRATKVERAVNKARFKQRRRRSR
jgi:hypothetical protein